MTGEPRTMGFHGGAPPFSLGKATGERAHPRGVRFSVFLSEHSSFS